MAENPIDEAFAEIKRISDEHYGPDGLGVAAPQAVPGEARNDFRGRWHQYCARNAEYQNRVAFLWKKIHDAAHEDDNVPSWAAYAAGEAMTLAGAEAKEWRAHADGWVLEVEDVIDESLFAPLPDDPHEHPTVP
jgi:hypothetical protein